MSRLVVMSVGTLVEVDADKWAADATGRLELTKGDSIVAAFWRWDWVANEEAIEKQSE